MVKASTFCSQFYLITVFNGYYFYYLLTSYLKGLIEVSFNCTEESLWWEEFLNNQMDTPLQMDLSLQLCIISAFISEIPLTSLPVETHSLCPKLQVHLPPHILMQNRQSVFWYTHRSSYLVVVPLMCMHHLVISIGKINLCVLQQLCNAGQCIFIANIKI